MKEKWNFAGLLANRDAKELRKSTPDTDSQPALEDPAVFGGSTTALPPGTVVELPEEGGYRVVEKPD